MKSYFLKTYVRSKTLSLFDFDSGFDEIEPLIAKLKELIVLLNGEPNFNILIEWTPITDEFMYDDALRIDPFVTNGKPDHVSGNDEATFKKIKLLLASF